jgi:hypothetical protein
MTRLDTSSWNDVYDSVDGWVGREMDAVVRSFDSIQQSCGVSGHIVEIGVHHGRLFFLLDLMRREGERSYAIDLFGAQDLNIDRSGGGTSPEAIFRNNVSKYRPGQEGQIEVISCDSLGLTPWGLDRRLDGRGVKFFSIDGGHTAMHVLNDMALAEAVLAPGGIIALDDFGSPFWPGVSEGFHRYMLQRNRRLAPILFFENKLFLTTYSEHHHYSDFLREELHQEFGEFFLTDRWKVTDICGFRTTVCV